jgi:hypothetical protein
LRHLMESLLIRALWRGPPRSRCLVLPWRERRRFRDFKSFSMDFDQVVC